MNRFFSGDYHFNHENILKYDNRPFENIEAMNEAIIRNHNERVKSEDEIYFHGDFMFRASKKREFRGEGKPAQPSDFLDKMNGNFIYISGNHDKPSNKFNNKITEIILNISKMKVQLIHNPKYAKIDYPLILCAHVHISWKVKELHYLGKKSLIINVGVPVWNYYPVSWSEIQAIYSRWKNGTSIMELNKWKGQNAKI